MNSLKLKINYSEILVKFYFLTKKNISTSFLHFLSNDLIRKTNKNGLITKAAFLEYFDIPYLISERLWDVLEFEFDFPDCVNKERFIIGMERLFMNEDNQRKLLKIIFKIYDFDCNGYISKNDVSIIFDSIFNFNSQTENKTYIKRRIQRSSNTDNYLITIVLERQKSLLKPINFDEFLSIVESNCSDLFYSVFLYLSRITEIIETMIYYEFYIINKKEKNDHALRYTMSDSMFLLKESILIEMIISEKFLISDEELNEDSSNNNVSLFYLKTVRDLNIKYNNKHNFLPKLSNKNSVDLNHSIVNKEENKKFHKKSLSTIVDFKIHSKQESLEHKKIERESLISTQLSKDLYTQVPMLSSKTEKIFEKYSKLKNSYDITKNHKRASSNEKYNQFLYLNLFTEGKLNTKPDKNDIRNIVIYKIKHNKEDFSPINLFVRNDFILYYKNSKPHGFINLNNCFITLDGDIIIGGNNRYHIFTLTYLNNKMQFYCSSLEDYKYMIIEISKFLNFVNTNFLISYFENPKESKVDNNETFKGLKVSKASDLLDKYNLLNLEYKKNHVLVFKGEKKHKKLLSSVKINKFDINKNESALGTLKEIKKIQSNKLKYLKGIEIKGPKDSDKFKIKVFNKSQMNNQEFISMRREVSIYYILNNISNFSTINSFFENDHYAYIILEEIDGYTLKEYLERNNNHLKELEIKNFIKQILNLVINLRSHGIIHRDLRPENIFITNKLGKDYLNIINFSIARQIGNNQLITNEPYGTFCFSAPEVILNNNYTFKAENFSLGILFFILIKGRFPFNETTPEKLAIKIIKCDINSIFNQNEKYGQLKDEFYFLSQLLNSNPSSRLSLKLLVNHSYLKYDEKYVKNSINEY